MRIAGVTLPNLKLPQQRFQWVEDIPRHLRKAKQIYLERFKCEPRGL